MRFLLQNPHTYNRKLSIIMSTNLVGLMGSSSLHFLRLKTLPLSSSSSPFSSHIQKFHTFSCKKHTLPSFCLKPMMNNHPSSLKTNGFPYSSPAIAPTTPVHHEDVEKTKLGLGLQILNSKLREMGIHLQECVPGQYNHLLCPMCKGGDSEEKSLSLFIDEDGGSALWMCFRAKCGYNGTTRAFGAGRSSRDSLDQITKFKIKKEITVADLELEPLCDEIVGYFAERMISKATLQRNRVMQRKYGDEIIIAFTYHRKGVLVSCKYRDITKKFWQEKDTEKIFYGLDDIDGEMDVIIVEGEMDKLAMEEAGFRNCVSVPDGAPHSVSPKDPPPHEKDTKYQYLWNCKEYLKEASRIILATDGDPPGQALAEELARRLGRERCWRVKWPKKNDVDYFKDANEVLMYVGPSRLKEVIENAELYPIQGLFNFKDYFNEIEAYYHQMYGFECGASTGWRALNELYNVVPGELTIVTGVPNSGKSEWIDALLCNLNESHGWKFALCSMENKVREHARKLLEKHIKKPFFDARYGESVDRMSAEELQQGKQWLSDTFYLIRCENDSLPSIKWVLDLAKAAVLRHGVRGLVIDPYNELDHQRPSNQTETEYVSQMMTLVKRFAQHHSCHVWFVAHPRQLHQWVGGPPNLYDISGSAHFINKCDNGIIIHRNRDPDAGPIDRVQVCVRKVRNKVIGTIGDAFLSYDRVSGKFMDIDEPTNHMATYKTRRLEA
ncbi:AAA_25 domain-containing protein/Toprim_4 domain-containing protein [Cephalotus follicularis]|uniref:AAA_25 domain-containing protein/Toprim_4 domain-containing protein n=1 Tax=Cephalotus follicularis TaxID=3775 RepID=A0A1Q3BCU3_CEPFO|nr:AAA_25 domain-containing protein/Toprim_4 domain-containing protein [Cephalotus follicularis]